MSSHTAAFSSTYFHQSQTHIVTQGVKFLTAGFLDIPGMEKNHSLSHSSHFTLTPGVTREKTMTVSHSLHFNSVPLAKSLTLYLTSNCPGETISFTLKKKFTANKLIVID